MSNDDPQTLKDVAEAASVKNGGERGRGLGRIAKSRDLKLSYTTVDKILDGTYKSRPSTATLDALAVLSGFSKEKVYAAAKVPLPMRPLAKDLPEDADTLTGPQRRTALDVIRLLAQQNRQLAELEDQVEELRNDDRSPANSEAGSGRNLQAVAAGGSDSAAQEQLAALQSALAKAEQRITELEVELKKAKRRT